MRPTTIREELEHECLKHIRRFGISVAISRRQQRQFNTRTWIKAKAPDEYEPSHWKLANSFNPFYVRKRIHQFCHAISQEIESGTFQPQASLHIPIAKPGGGTRTIAISTIPDAAVSRWLYKRLIAKNLHILSSYAFAYRPDRCISHAIEHLHRFVQRNPRSYIVEYDFRSYFDTIDHDYLLGLLGDRMRIGKKELAVATAFLKGKFTSSSSLYEAGRFTARTRGIAQGSCLSLFLANLACLELDEDLEKTGACYARYADDTVVLCRTYSQASECADVLHRHKLRAGTELNLDKSDGISLLTNESKAEIRVKNSFVFLGHEIRDEHIALAPKTMRKIKNRIGTIIHRHLLLYPAKYDQMSSTRIDIKNRVDWDLVTCLNEIRKYIYGGITESQLREEHVQPIHRREATGVVAFFSNVTSGDRFRQLDGWLINVIRRALAERRRRLWGWYQIQTPMLTRGELVSGEWYKIKKIPNDTRMPSFFNVWKAVRRVVVSQGPGAVSDRGYGY